MPKPPLLLYAGTGSTAPRIGRRQVAEALARHAVQGSATTATRTAVREAATVLEAPQSGEQGRLLVQLIKAGWSLNGTYYPAEVLRRDGPAAWPAGTLNYVDHATDEQDEQHPTGSLLRLASYQTTDARWDEERQALVAEVRAFAPWREAVTDWAKSQAIGMSIRAWVYGEEGEAEGRTGFIVSGIPQGRSCDYVTVPAAGGALLSVLESVQRRVHTAEARNVGAWLESRLHLALTQLGDDMYGDGRLTRDERIVLSTAIGEALQAWTARVESDAPQLFTRDLWAYPEPATTAAEEARRVAEATAEETRSALAAAVADAHGGEDTWTWIRDWDPDRNLVWFDVASNGASATWQQAYTIAGRTASLTGDRVEVTARTVYDPVPADGDPGDADESAPTPTPPAAVAVTEDVTDGAPPTAPNPPTEGSPGMSGSDTGTTPEQAGTATVVDTPPANTPAAEAPRTDPALVTALEAMTARLEQMEQRLTAESARADQRDAEARTLRNTARARDAVAEALRAPALADVATQIGPRVTARVLASIPTTAEGVVDEAGLAEAVAQAVADEADYLRGERARVLESAGVGQPYGLGGAPVAEGDDKEAAAFETELASFFSEALGLDSSAAKIAAKGR